jgi:hypothetical protein
MLKLTGTVTGGIHAVHDAHSIDAVDTRDYALDGSRARLYPRRQPAT